MPGPDTGSLDRSPDERLLDAARTGQVCDFSDGSPITREDMAEWGVDRTVSAALVRQLLLGEHPDCPMQRVAVRGAVIAGELDVQDASVVGFALTGCRLGPIDLRGATFTGDAWFGRATFTGDAWFGGATFTGDAWFSGATFTGDAWFGGATFTGDAWFSKATFTGAAWFGGATFTRAAWFSKATFTGAARFDGATFTRAAWFGGALAERWDLSRSRFESPDPGPWSGSDLDPRVVA